MNRWFYACILAAAGLMMCRDAATLAAETFTANRPPVQLTTASILVQR